jgi:hypothetical protein
VLSGWLIRDATGHGSDGVRYSPRRIHAVEVTSEHGEDIVAIAP